MQIQTVKCQRCNTVLKYVSDNGQNLFYCPFCGTRYSDHTVSDVTPDTIDIRLDRLELAEQEDRRIVGKVLPILVVLLVLHLIFMAWMVSRL